MISETKFEARYRARHILFSALALALTVPVAIYLYHELSALPSIVRVVVSALAVTVSWVAWYVMRPQMLRFGAMRMFLVVMAASLGMLLCSSKGSLFIAADDASFGFPDGSQKEHVKPQPHTIRGRSYDLYSLQSAFGLEDVENSVTATFLSVPKKLTVWFTKPADEAGLHTGSAISSRETSVVITAFDSNGLSASTQNFGISQNEFLVNRLVAKQVDVASGISKIKVEIGTGLPASATDIDTTSVAFEVQNTHAYILAMGQILLVGIAFSNFALFFFFSCQNLGFSCNPTKAAAILKLSIPYLFLTILVLLIAYWSASQTSFIYFWDVRNYWQKTEVLYEHMSSGAWKQAVGAILAAYSSDYSMLPAIAPATLSLLTGYPTRLNYLLSVCALYTVPAYVLVAYLAKKLLSEGNQTQVLRNSTTWVFSSLAVLFCIPLFFGITLSLMPDIGGVIFFILALLYAASVAENIAIVPNEGKRDHASAELIRASLGLGLMVSVMFLFRRWYIFAAAGIISSCAILISYELWIQRTHRVAMIKRLSVAIILMCFAAFPLLAWVAFDWSRNFAQHDYANLYSSYNKTLQQNLVQFVSCFGIVVPVLSFSLIILVRNIIPARRLLFILAASSIIACFLFLRVQSPVWHHYYLLMPLFGGSLAAASIIVFRRHGLFKTIALGVVLLLGGISIPWLSQEKKGIEFLFPGYGSWMPRQEAYVAGYEEIAQWLMLPINARDKFCVVASSAKINQGKLLELWQILPFVKKGAFDNRLVHLGEVDSWHGPPSKNILRCDIALVGNPFQSHLDANEQVSVKIVQEDLIKGTGVGAAFEKTPKIFFMGEDVRILAYKRLREITDEEYSDLNSRFRTLKGVRYVPPRT